MRRKEQREKSSALKHNFTAKNLGEMPTKPILVLAIVAVLMLRQWNIVTCAMVEKIKNEAPWQ